MTQTKHYPDALQSLFLTLGVLGFQILFGIIIGVFSAIYLNSLSLNLIVICSMLSIIVILFIGIKKGGIQYKSLFISPSGNLKTYAFSLILLVGIWGIVVSTTSMLINSIPFLRDASSSLDIVSNAISTWFGLLYVIIIGPVFEEVLFRGLILQGLLKNNSIKKAVIISSLLFGLVHFNIIQSFTAILIGLVFATIYIKTGSLKLCILAHIINNSLSIFLSDLIQNLSNFIILPLGIVIAAVGFILITKSPNNISHIFEVKPDDNIVDENNIQL